MGNNTTSFERLTPTAPPAEDPPAYPLVMMCPGCTEKIYIPVGTTITSDKQLYCDKCIKKLDNWHCSGLGECDECSDTELPVMQLKNKEGNLCLSCYVMLQ